MKFYIVGTPIGNLDDMTFRAIQTLKSVDVILCEDTRVTQKLLNHFDIHTPLRAYHDFNKESIEDAIIEDIHQGLVFALVSDAGMPLISDPGFELIQRLQQEGIQFEIIPGPTAFVSAVVASGINSYEFTFYGFLPKSNKKRKEKLEEILNDSKTSILYESPHKIQSTIEHIARIDAQRNISISREITKRFEQHTYFPAEQMKEEIGESIPVKGEFVIVIEGKIPTKIEYDVDVYTHVEQFIEGGLKPKAAIKEVARLRNLKAQDVYNEYHQKK